MGENKEIKDFNIYYLNFSKVYEMAMIINNQIVKSLQKEKGTSDENSYSFTSEIGASAGDGFLTSVKSSISSDYSEKHTTNSKVVESIEVQTTKSTLLRRILTYCKSSKTITADVNEGDLIKLDNVKLQLLDEESLRQFLVLKRDALKGLRVEGMEVNNIVSSMLQDYSYVLVGKLENEENKNDILIKIPMESQAEFENKYKVDDILIGKVSIIGIYKGKVNEETITANTFSFFRERGEEEAAEHQDRVIKSNTSGNKKNNINKQYGVYDYLDVFAIIQDVNFKEITQPQIKLRWWNRFGLWLAGVGRKYVG